METGNHMIIYHAYILQSESTGYLYIGHTDDLEDQSFIIIKVE